MSGAPVIPAEVHRSLRDTFGIRHLREGQQEVIARVLKGKDTLAIMPTGAGKSLCYQLPALHLEGTTVVISPLISLMKDQARKLEEAGVAAEQLNSAVPKREQDASMERIADAQSEIVFATPERLGDPEFLQTLQRQRIALLVVDEAHCISQWGHDFRPAFLEISQALEALGRPPVLALTATATREVVEDILQQLGRAKMHVVNTGIFRPNLRLQVVQSTNEDEKFLQLRDALSKARGCGIVYTATVKACEELHRCLGAPGESVAMYHGKLSANERHDNQDRFMRGDARVMIATNAFGMGIDKPDIRFVIHYQMPGSPEAYYQEAGRAGRDGEVADCVLLFFRKDRQVQQFFLARRYPSSDDLRQVCDVMQHAGVPLHTTQISERLPQVPRNRVAVALKLLCDGGIARSDRQREWSLKPGKRGERQILGGLAADYEAKAERDREALERMVFYAQTGFCRWRVLLEYFDEPLPFLDRCGCCDNCLRPLVRPAPLIKSTEIRLPAPPPPAARFRPGDVVRVARYGEGRVAQVTGDQVTVLFPDRCKRSFLADYVQSS
ncbi:MAG TPA: ATP-dependent DNA helicase RecQ [Burkholderiaceae bacterium]|nr:ATP-dependent DNA helicase RecQ [Burkholderiaceae bacterium]